MLAHGNAMGNDHTDDIGGLKARPKDVQTWKLPPHRPGFQPWNIMMVRDLGRCPRLGWDGPLARKSKTGTRENVPNLFPPRSRTVSLVFLKAR